MRVEIKGLKEAGELVKRNIKKIPENISQKGLDEIAMKYVQAIQQQLKENDSIATRRLINSFRARRVENNVIHISVIGPAARYAGLLEQTYGFKGGPGGAPPWDKIKEWADRKGIEHGKAYNIWKKWYEGRGVKKAHPYMDKALNKGRRELDEIINRHSKIK